MTRAGRVGVGVAGAGNISTQYLTNLTAFPDLDVRFVADVDVDRARAQATAFGIPACGTLEELLADDGVELVVNLTPPAAHAAVTLAALDRGRHAWTEKPLATSRADALAILERSRATGLLVGCAPDTFLGPGLQATREAVEGGAIGSPLAALVLFQGPGPERWHPNPAFLFARGAGPLFDIGPYSLTALVQLLGPIERVSAAAQRGQAERFVHQGPHAGERFPVEMATNVQALYRFRGGASAVATYSFDSMVRRTLFELTGPTGTLEVPDPNEFAGDLRIHRPEDAVEILRVPTETPTRGVGVLDLARAVRGGRRPRASAELGYHVLDVMTATIEAAEGGLSVDVASDCEPAPMLGADWDPFATTLA